MELKAMTVLNIQQMGCYDNVLVYFKSEADKVIAELKADYKEACDRLQTANLIKDEQLVATRRQKYKRCLAMANICCEKKENCYNRALRKYSKDEADYLASKSEFWQDWEFRWFKISEKFKEAK